MMPGRRARGKLRLPPTTARGTRPAPATSPDGSTVSATTYATPTPTKLGTSNRVEAARLAREKGWLQPVAAPRTRLQLWRLPFSD
ncbi:MAG: hypothetical protein R3E98_16975, partial [Gemmatimonadota bacterium]